MTYITFVDRDGQFAARVSRDELDRMTGEERKDFFEAREALGWSALVTLDSTPKEKYYE